jgi:hypothetical protein
MIENHRYEWAVTSTSGEIIRMFLTKEFAQRWADMHKGVYKIRRLTDEDFETTTNFGVRS